MELKSEETKTTTNDKGRFNRTFMELKYLGSEHVSMRQISFNRTFMELK